MQTLLVGLDAASPAVIDRLRSTDSIPTLASIVDRGASGPLTSQIPPWTASAWPSLYTGKNPGKHGVFGFLQFDGYDWSVVNGSYVREPALWEILDRHGYRSVVVNVPVTHPPRSFDGALIPGYTAPNTPTCHPAGLLEEVTDVVSEYCVYAPDVADEERATRREWYRRLASIRGSAFRYLSAEYDPDFGFLQFQQTDTVFHQEADFDAARLVYEAVDEEVRKTIDSCDPDHVVIASDHGMGRYCGTRCHVNEHLRKTGHVTAKRGGRGMPTWVTVRDEQLRTDAGGDQLGGDGDSGLTQDGGLPARVVGGLACAGLTTERLQTVLERIGIADAVAEHVPLSVSRAGTAQVDFAASRAYVRDRVELGVRINLAGREPDGTVPADEYDAVRAALIQSLAALETPDGEPVFEEVAPREAYFHGPAAEDAVDVVTVPRNFDHLLSSTLGGSVFDPVADDWHHKREGLIAATGPRIDTGNGVGDAHLFDVAPTVLSTMGVPYGERMDGTPLPCVDAGDTRPYSRHDDRQCVVTADQAVESHLTALGYLEEP